MSVQQMCTGEPALVPGELRGYRQWRCVGPQLLALNMAHGEWIRPELDAICRRGWMAASDPDHEAPNAECGCGIYGWYRPDSAWRQGHAGGVFGVVAASGRVLLGDYGFRAQRARIVALAADVQVPGLAEYWQPRGVEVFSSRARLIEAYPPDDVRELLGRDMPPENGQPAGVAFINVSASYRGMLKALEDDMKRVARAAAQSGHQFDALSRLLGYGGMSRADAEAAARKLAAFGVSGAGYARQSAFWAAASSGTPNHREDAMRYALERRRQGARGPEKRRRGRARLSL